MRKLLNTLYVTLSDAYLARDGENVVVRSGDEERFRVPIHNLEGIITFGYTGASPALMGLCAERGVALSFLTEHGRFLARVTGGVSGNVLLRRKQYRMADDEDASLAIAGHMVTGKIANARTVLQRGLRDHEGRIRGEVVQKAVNSLAGILREIPGAGSLNRLRGMEGDAAKIYFEAIDELILEQKETFYMRGRSRRPPLDCFNALLSFLYTLLAHDVEAALETVGLDPSVGFLHRDRPGRASLALDVMEELRPYLAERMALSLINRRQVDSKSFYQKENGAVYMDAEARKTVLTAWQKRKAEEITHPFLGEKVPIGLIPYVQSLLLARYLRGDLDGYPPFVWR
ncbi:type I-C CRISPR-associated endonuclease Cas1 [Heliobacterium undosum]|uniref:CRISPR-associated endonuclease Cas1 n=1 Tax=Heliomicrobium undosum TaxID=121734 RepID=A0A845L3E1_9FIRM|nr:type I-C CRISPR-associated endonuclease Cas1c [Heliomicrobium undosum]MZP30793.1 type I-C CRISPR-associated endonuclease Cas1 [Heliomicrobium undosum]